MVFLFTSLVTKAAELVPVLFQTIEKIKLNDVISVLIAIDEFYNILPDPELYARGMEWPHFKSALIGPSAMFRQ